MPTWIDYYQAEAEAVEHIEQTPPRFTVLEDANAMDRKDNKVEVYMEIIKEREEDIIRAEEERALKETQTFKAPRIEIDSDELKLRLKGERDDIISRRNVVKLIRGKDDRNIALAVIDSDGNPWYLLNIITRGENKGKIDLCGGVPSRLGLKLERQGMVKII